MKLFNKEGMMIIPNPIKIEIKESDNVLVLRECYCKLYRCVRQGWL